MTSKFYTIISFLFFVLHHQNLAGQQLSIGVNTGMTISTMKSEEEDKVYGEPKYFKRLTARGDIRMRFDNHFGIRLEMAYEQIGARRKIKTNFGYGFDKYKFNYLTLPLIGEFSVGKTSKLTAHFGASIGYLMKQNWVVDSENKDWTVDNTEEYQRINYSLLGGLGAEFPLSKSFLLQLEGRCSVGQKTLQKENSWVKSKHFGFVSTIGVRYIFDVWKK